MSSIAESPAGWITIRLGDAGRWHGGGTPSKFEPRFWTEGCIPWVSPKDMKSLRIVGSEDRITEAATSETNVKPFPTGTVLVVIRSGILSRTLPIGVAEVPGTMNQDLKGVLPGRGLDSMFLAYQLIGREHEVLKRCSKHGTTVASIDTERLHDFPIRLAPLPEQRRIVAKIEELFSDLDAGVAALTRVKAKLKRYRAAVLKAAVEGRLTEDWRKQHPNTEPASKLLERILAERRAKWEAEQLRKYKEKGKEPPKGWRERYEESAHESTVGVNQVPAGWCVTQIGTIAETATGGTPSRSRLEFFDGDVPWVKSGELGDSVVSQTEEYISQLGLDSSSAKVFPAGTLCIALYGATVGKVGILGIDAATNQAICAIFLPLAIDTRFAFHYLISIRSRLVELGKGGAQPNISNGIIRATEIPMPPLAEQAEIVAEVDRRLSVVDAAESQVELGLQRASRLRQAILKRAFEGRLVPQDPSDEPAAVIMERIRADREEVTAASNGAKARAAAQTLQEPRKRASNSRGKAALGAKPVLKPKASR